MFATEINTSHFFDRFIIYHKLQDMQSMAWNWFSTIPYIYIEVFISPSLNLWVGQKSDVIRRSFLSMTVSVDTEAGTGDWVN